MYICKDVHLNILTNIRFTYFRLPWWFIVDVDNNVEPLHNVDMTRVSNISDIYAASIYRIEVNRVDKSNLLQLWEQ
jgi:hypothetical protein